MNTFKKINDTWAIAVTDPQATTGSTVTVAKRDGSTQQVTLGAPMGSGYGARYFAAAPRPQAPAPAAQAVGDLTGILAVFNTAKQHLKFPAIVLDGFRVSVAGARAAQPGTLNVTAIEKTFNNRRGTMERAWFGRVSLDGSFAPSRIAPMDLADKLRKFAADPAGEAAAYGKLTGRCCFCNHALGEGEDRRSVEVGYGPVCADHFGLPWGASAAPAAVDCADPDCRVCETDDTANLSDDEMGINRPQRAERFSQTVPERTGQLGKDGSYEGDVDGQAARRQEQPRYHLRGDDWRNRSRRRDYA